MHPAMEQLSQLLGGALLGRGHRVQLVQGEGDQGPSRLVEALKQMGGALTQSAGGKEQKETGRRSRPKSALPPILPGTPITEVLRTIRQTLAAAAANAEPDDEEEEDDEDAAGEAAADTSFGRIIAHLDERGLELLERQLRGKLALVSAARSRFSTRRSSRGAAADEDEEEAAEEAEKAEAVEAAQEAGTRRSSTLSAVLNSMLGTGAASSQLRSSGGGGGGGGEADESTDSYASRLATEARKRERASRGGAEDDDAADGEGEVFNMQLPEEVLRRFLSGANNLEGNADGEEAVTQMKIYVTGPDGEAREMQVNEGDVNGHASSIFDIIRRVTEKQTDDDDSAGTRGGGDSGSTATGDDAIGGKGTEPEI